MALATGLAGGNAGCCMPASPHYTHTVAYPGCEEMGITSADHWHTRDLTAPYLPHDLGSNGFIHCTQGLYLSSRIYDPLNQDAIVAIHTMPRHTDECFRLPIYTRDSRGGDTKRIESDG